MSFISDVLDYINRIEAENSKLQAEIERLKKEPYQFADIGKMHSKVKAEAINALAENINKIITEIYNKHIFGNNDLNDEEKDAVINYSDDVMHGIAKLLMEMLGELEDDSGRQRHYLKILPEYYILIDEGIKTFEIRFNDRDYKVGDILHLQEFVNGEYTGRELTKEISYMIDSPDYCKDGFVVLSIKNI